MNPSLYIYGILDQTSLSLSRVGKRKQPLSLNSRWVSGKRREKEMGSHGLLAKRALETDSPVMVQIQELLRGVKDAMSLAQGVVYWQPPKCALDKVKELVWDPSVSRYGADEGLPELREALTKKLYKENKLQNSSVMVTAGANQAFVNVVLTLCDAGDTVIMFAPYYFNAYMSFQMTGVTDILVGPGDANTLHPDAEWLEKTLSENKPTPKLVTVVNPGNPSGTYIPEPLLKKISDICKKAGCWLVVDNTYEYFMYDGRKHSCIEDDHIVNIFSFSKAYGMMGWRVGYIAYPKGVEGLGAQLVKIQDNIPICASIISQHLALHSLETGPEWVTDRVKNLVKNREIVLEALYPLGEAAVKGGEGAIYLWAKLPEKYTDDFKVVRWLAEKHGVVIIPGSASGGPGHVRVSFGGLDREERERRKRREMEEQSSNWKTPEIKFTKLFINGEFVDSISGKKFETIDPRTGEVTAEIEEGDKEDVDVAVKAARQAFDHGPWPRYPGYVRGKLMMKLADLMEEHIEEIATLDTIDAGKLFTFCKAADIPFAIHTLRYYAGAADKIHGETLKMSSNHQGYTLREPIGVVGIIVPWNYPTNVLFNKVSPALAAGCTLVVKPAEQTPLTALYYAHLAKLAGIPEGVINVITGYGPTAGAAISSHMDIDKVSFTGSTEVGRQVMQAAATSNLKSVTLELGGKNPLIVFDDADVDAAVDLSLLGGLCNKGEICAASSRIFVQEKIYDEFANKLVEKTKNWSVGDPFDPSIRQGPQVDKKQYDKILSYIEHGKREGATLLAGGRPCNSKGYYIEPTIFGDVKDDTRVAQDEIFGPIVSLFKFKTIEEAIRRANATKYGLTAGIVTKDLNVANTVSRSIRAGTIWINCYVAFDAGCPFGGYKMSGFGKEYGMEALHEYLQLKSVVTPIYNSPWL